MITTYWPPSVSGGGIVSDHVPSAPVVAVRPVEVSVSSLPLPG